MQFRHPLQKWPPVLPPSATSIPSGFLPFSAGTMPFVVSSRKIAMPSVCPAMAPTRARSGRRGWLIVGGRRGDRSQFDNRRWAPRWRENRPRAVAVNEPREVNPHGLPCPIQFGECVTSADELAAAGKVPREQKPKAASGRAGNAGINLLLPKHGLLIRQCASERQAAGQSCDRGEPGREDCAQRYHLPIRHSPEIPSSTRIRPPSLAGPGACATS